MKTDNLRMLITGVSGLLGNNLALYFRDKYEVLGLYLTCPVNIKGIYTEKCDISDLFSIKKIILEFKPSVIIHCASLTNIDQCEIDKELAKTINIIGTDNIVKSILDKNLKLIYISSDSVYDGIKGNFSEDDEIRPQNYYGISKYEGELKVLMYKNSLILRTNLFGWNIQNKKSLAEWILEELKMNHQINCFKDAYFSSIYTFELAKVIDIAIQHNLKGIYNCGSSTSCSKYEFALKIADYFNLDKKLIKPISIDEFNFKAKRGKNLTLNVMKIQKALDYRLPDINQSIEAFYRDYKCGLPDFIKNNQVKKENNFEFIPYGRQWINENDILSVTNVLRSNRLTQGPIVEKFERAVAEYCGAKYAIATNSGTSALHIACLAAGINEGDEVITSPITFVASANCAVYCRAKPIFADIDKKTYNISPEEIDKKISSKTKAIIAVHFAGQSCDMKNIYEIVKRAEKIFGKKIFIIEDACHALGSIYNNTKVGSCVFSDMTILSFHPVKHITTGEGGMILTNDEELYKKLKRLRSHGITSNVEEFTYKECAYTLASDKEILNPWYYEQIDLGYNYRITDIQCALGISQLKRLKEFIHRRRYIVERYNAVFDGFEFIKTPLESENCKSNFHLYVLLIDFDAIGINRAYFMYELKKRGIQTQVHYIPVHTQPFYRKHFNTNWGDCPNAEDYYRKCLSIPLFPAMGDEEVNKVIKEILSLIKK